VTWDIEPHPSHPFAFASAVLKPQWRIDRRCLRPRQGLLMFQGPISGRHAPETEHRDTNLISDHLKILTARKYFPRCPKGWRGIIFKAASAQPTIVE
jgi:hypothetical protein